MAPRCCGASCCRSLIGTPGLAALAVAVAAVTAGLPRAGSLAGLLLLPLGGAAADFRRGVCGDGGNQPMALEAAVSIAADWPARRSSPAPRSALART